MHGALRTCLFLAPFVPLHFAFCFAYERTVLERQPLRVTERQLTTRLASADRVRTLALGDSHPRGAVDPGVIEGAFNFTSSGENAAVTYFKLRWALDAARDVDVVVMPVDLHSFSSFRSETFARPALLGRYVDWADVGRTAHAPLRSLGLAAAARFPYLSGADDTVETLWPSSDAFADARRQVRDGFFGVAASFAKDKNPRRLAASRAHDHFAGRDVLEPSSVEYFRRSLELCAARRVRVALARFPVSEEYWNEAKRLVDPDAFYAEVASVVGARDGVRVLDHHADFFGKNELMRDADHVNVRGAALFSAALGAEVAALRSGSR